jgi:FkbH-like protein
MYMSDAKRNENEERFEGPKEEFLSSLQMRLRIASATVGDLQRAEELTVRTNQLNTTGLTFSYEELSQLLDSSNHLLWIAGLEDRYGSYGKIGLVLIEFTDEVWEIKLLLMSCRVMARGIGNVLINLIRGYAKQAGVRLQAGFVETDRNRMMYMTYKFSRFVEISREGSLLTLENDLHDVSPPPSYLELDISNLALPVSVPLGQAVTL